MLSRGTLHALRYAKPYAHSSNAHKIHFGSSGLTHRKIIGVIREVECASLCNNSSPDHSRCLKFRSEDAKVRRVILHRSKICVSTRKRVLNLLWKPIMQSIDTRYLQLGHNGRSGLGSTVLLVRLEIFCYVFIIEVSSFLAHHLGMLCATSVQFYHFGSGNSYAKLGYFWHLQQEPLWLQLVNGIQET